MAVESLDVGQLNANETHLIKFTSPTCGPCKIAAAEVDEVASDEQYDDVRFWEVNVMSSEYSQLVKQLSIKTVPVVVLMRDGNMTNIMMGGDIRAENIRKALRQSGGV